jgi:hypothetical protein
LNTYSGINKHPFSKDRLSPSVLDENTRARENLLLFFISSLVSAYLGEAGHLRRRFYGQEEKEQRVVYA